MDTFFQASGLGNSLVSRRPHGSAGIRRAASGIAFHLALLAVSLALLDGCASPGPPKPPSLNLPQPVSDLAVARTGNLIELRFTVPHLTTDKLPLVDPHHHKIVTLNGTICRELRPASCIPVASIAPQLTAVDHETFLWHETLSAGLDSGSPRLLIYRVEFINKSGKSAGQSNAAFTAAGTAPSPVIGLRADGSRSGIVLAWQQDSTSAETLLHRIDLAPRTDTAKSRPKSPVVSAGSANDLWLNANSSQARTLDASVSADTSYRYTALRRVLLTLDRHPVELRSDVSPAIDFTLKPVYAPSAPTGLDATGFAPPDGSHYAVDLIWQPVSDAGITPALASPLAGYAVYRERLDHPGTKARLTSTPTPQPSFHDTTAEPATRYRYSITAIDGNGNESAATSFTLEPAP